jgi:cytochrome c peroxidase
MMNIKQITAGILIGVTGLVMVGMVACDNSNTITTGELKKPNLTGTSFNYESVNLSNGTTITIKNLLLSRAFGVTNNFPPGNQDDDMLEAANTFSNASATLGRVLFYDKRMSLNNTVSCGSCHHQALGFSDRMPISVGFGGRVTRRNSMSINNPATFNNLFWDSRAQSPMDLSLRPVFDHIEMGMESDEMLEKKLAATDFYGPLFQEAFGSPEVTRRKISLAVTHFVTSMITMNSKTDQVDNGLAKYSVMEKMGRDIFFSERASCFKCHSGTNFSAPDDPGGAYGSPTVAGTANVGLDKTYADNGKGNGKFRIPSLRNIELSAPYMHDGRFGSLEQVIEHYSHGIQAHPHLDANLKDDNGQPKRMNFNAEEKDALIAFLRTLTDVSFISNPKYSDPFAN